MESVQRTSTPGREYAAARPFALFVGGVAAVAFVLLSLADGGFESGTWGQVTVLAWWTAIVAILAGAWPRAGLPAAAALTGLALLGLVALNAASMLWAADLGGAYADAVRAAGYLGIFVVSAIACRAGFGRPLLAGLAAGLTALAAIALISRLEPGFAGGADEAFGLRVSGGRLGYPLGYWNALGACMAAAIPLLASFAAGSDGSRARALALAAIPFPALTLFFSGSRGGALAAAVGCGVLLLAGPRRINLAAVLGLGLAAAVPLVLFAAANDPLVDGESGAAAAAAGDQLLFITVAVVVTLGIVGTQLDGWIAGLRPRRLGLRGGIVVGAIVLLAGAGAVIAADPGSRLDALDAPPESPRVTAAQESTRFANIGGSGRTDFWDAAVEAAREEPLRGIGAGGYEGWWNLNGDLRVPVKHAHSLFLESAAEVGIGGALLALAFFAVPAVAGVRRLRAASAPAGAGVGHGVAGAALAVLAAALVTACLEWTWDVPAAFVPGVVGAAFLTAPAPTAGSLRSPARRRRGLALALGLIVVGLACAGAGALLFLSEEALERSRELAASGQPRQAVAEARRASDWTPFASEPWVQIAQLQRELGDVPAAREAIGEAEERDELDWRLWFVEAGIELDRGEPGRGVYALNHARTLYPRGPIEFFVLPGGRPETAPVILRSAQRAARG